MQLPYANKLKNKQNCLFTYVYIFLLIAIHHFPWPLKLKANLPDTLSKWKTGKYIEARCMPNIIGGNFGT